MKSSKSFPASLCLLVIACNSTDNTNSPSRFVDVTQEVGLDFVHEAGAQGRYFMPEEMGAGSALFDYDGDGDLDVYLVNGGWIYSERKVKNRLFRQESDGRFLDVTEESGLGDTGFGMGVAVGDIDNDGDADVYVTNFGGDSLYVNNGDGTFRNATEAAGVDNPGWGCSATFFDFDLDGFLDLYVTNYVDYDSSVTCTDKAGRKHYCGPRKFNGSVDVLYRNLGDGRFADVSLQSGVARFNKRGLGVVAADVDADGWPDIYVANDAQENLLWMNQKDGTFQEQATRFGLALNKFGQAEAGMGIAIGDVNGDLKPDFLVTHLERESNTMYVSSTAAGYLDNSLAAGFEAPQITPFTGFGSGFVDFNLDGFLDLAVGNGRVDRASKPLRQDGDYWADYAEPNLIFLGEGDGRFKNGSGQFSDFSAPIENTRGMAFGDIDNDGDVDILVNNCGGKVQLFRNEVEREGAWLIVEPFDPALQRSPQGAQVLVKAGGKTYYGEVRSGYSYLCSNDPRVHFGLGKVDKIDEIAVIWPDGEKEIFGQREVNRFVRLEKGKASD